MPISTRPSRAIGVQVPQRGQTCVCTNRFYVQEGVHGAFVRELALRVRALPVGDGFSDGVLRGPLITEKAFERVCRALRSGLMELSLLSWVGTSFKEVFGFIARLAGIGERDDRVAAERQQLLLPIEPIGEAPQPCSRWLDP